MEVAQKLFKEKGYSGTSMRDIAEDLGIKVSSIYNHVQSKEEILKNICISMADAFFSSIDEIKDLGVFPGEKLHLAIESHISVITSNLEAAPVFLHEWKYLTEPELSEFKALRGNYEKIFRDIIQDGIAKQSFQEVDDRFLTMMIFSSMNWIYDWYKADGKMSPRDIAETLSEFILNGINK